eukprot:7074097-Pyramimonas_sp.AAC.1
MRREEVALASSRLGSIGVQRVGASLQEIWEDGIAFAHVAERARALAEQREASPPESPPLESPFNGLIALPSTSID